MRAGRESCRRARRETPGAPTGRDGVDRVCQGEAARSVSVLAVSRIFDGLDRGSCSRLPELGGCGIIAIRPSLSGAAGGPAAPEIRLPARPVDGRPPQNRFGPGTRPPTGRLPSGAAHRPRKTRSRPVPDAARTLTVPFALFPSSAPFASRRSWPPFASSPLPRFAVADPALRSFLFFCPL